MSDGSEFAIHSLYKNENSNFRIRLVFGMELENFPDSFAMILFQKNQSLACRTVYPLVTTHVNYEQM